MPKCVLASFTLLLLWLLEVSALNPTFVVPSFQSLPPPVTYLKDESSFTLNCVPSVPDSVVHCGFIGNAGQKIHFSTAKSDVTRGVRCLVNAIHITPSLLSREELERMQLFCKVISTSKFAVISDPFRLKKAVLDDFSSPVFVGTKQTFKGNNVQISCVPPKSEPPAKITFTVDDKLLPGFDRYRVVTLASGNVVLLITKVLSEDGDKKYGCNATNTVTGETKKSLVTTYLTVRQAMEVFAPKIVEAPSPTELLVDEGSNVSYTCITESSPISEVSFLRDSGNKLLPPTAKENRSFGLLQFLGIQKSDEGMYACRVSYTDPTSSSHYSPKTEMKMFSIKVKKRLTIAAKPLDVVMSSQTAVFNCRLEGSEKVAPLWFNNGRLIDISSSEFTIQEQSSDPSMSRLHVRRFDESIRGVIQCVASDWESGIWESAQATLIQRGEQVIVGSAPLPPVVPDNKEQSGRDAVRPLPSPNPDQKTQPPPVRETGINTNPIAPEPEKRLEMPLFISTPAVNILRGNLAVNVSWFVQDQAFIDKISYFRLQYVQKHYKEKNFDLDNPHTDTYTIGLQSRVTDYYKIWINAKERHDYKFRVVYSLKESPHNMQYSLYSSLVSFRHIAEVKAPKILKLPSHIHDYIEWSFDSMYKLKGYTIWVRRTHGPDKRYTEYIVNEPTATRFYFYDLEPKVQYAVVMFARLEDPDQSNPSLVSPNSPTVEFIPISVKLMGDTPNKPGFTSSHLMFILFGVLGLGVLIVLVILICMCVRKSQMEKRRSDQPNEAWSNTFTYASQMPAGYPGNTYKDPAKMIHRETLSRQPHNNFSLSMLNGQPQISPGPPLYAGYGQAYPGTMNLPFGMQGHPGEASPMLLDHYQQQAYMGSQQRLHHAPPAYGLGTLSKREPPSGGSLHENPSDLEDFETGETLYQRGHHQPSSFGYSQTAQRLGINLNPPGMAPDNESVYSYFSQLDTYAQTPYGQGSSRQGSHLNLQQHGSMVDSGAQTMHDRPQHRHHKRKRRRPRETPSTPPVMRDMSTNTDLELSEAPEEEEDDTLPPPPPHHRGHHGNNGEIYERPEDVLGHSIGSGHSGFHTSTPMQTNGSRENTPQRTATASLHRPGRNMHMPPGAAAIGASLPRRAFSPGPPKMRGITDYAVPQQQQMMQDTGAPGAPAGLTYTPQPQMQLHMPYQSNRGRQDYPV